MVWFKQQTKLFAPVSILIAAVLCEMTNMSELPSIDLAEAKGITH